MAKTHRKPKDMPSARPHSMRPDQVMKGDVFVRLKQNDEEYVLRIQECRHPKYGRKIFVFEVLDFAESKRGEYIGVLTRKTGYVKLTEKSKLQAQSRLFMLINRIFFSIWSDRPLPNGTSIKPITQNAYRTTKGIENVKC